MTNIDIAVVMTVATEKGGGALLPRVKSGEEKIYVTVRVRPLSGKEISRSDVSDWECTNDNTIAFKHALPERSPFPAAYTFGEYDVLPDQQCILQFDLLYLSLFFWNYILNSLQFASSHFANTFTYGLLWMISLDSLTFSHTAETIFSVLLSMKIATR